MTQTTKFKPVIGGCAVHGKDFRSKEAYDAHMKAKHPKEERSIMGEDADCYNHGDDDED